ncbi:hypothetical protein [Micavibrio aeruginosavorus]|uniref:hypothetical protein n=1 Tax=Micavibrio aeruginosavorus TaxID=349221 RepID=UPI001F1E7A73|nr:hypothetical protein [Micavibrio aeruginosavorus]
MGILKFSAAVGGAVGTFLAVSTFSSPVKSTERFVNNCISGYEKEGESNPLLDGVDKAGFCGCLAEKKIDDNFTYDTMKPCMDAHMKEPVVRFCEDDLSKHMEGYVNCECIYDHTAQWVFKSAAAASHKGPQLSKADETQASITMIQECEFR